MSEKPEKNEKTRVSVTMTGAYIEALDHLVDEGLYLGRGEIVLEALRRLFRGYGLEPFSLKLEPEEPAV